MLCVLPGDKGGAFPLGTRTRTVVGAAETQIAGELPSANDWESGGPVLTVPSQQLTDLGKDGHPLVPQLGTS